MHWKGYRSDEDTWELAEELRYMLQTNVKKGFCCYLDLINFVLNFSNCQDAIREFVTSGFKSKILPLPVRTCF